MLYEKRPIRVEARQLTPTSVGAIAEWCGGRAYGAGVAIDTPEGVMTASMGDFVIKGVRGEFYPCKPDIFGMTYQPVYGE